MHPNRSATGGPSKSFNVSMATNRHISWNVNHAVLLSCISPFTNSPTTVWSRNLLRLWQKLCSLLSKVRRWLLQTWKPWWPKALKVLPLGLPSKTKGLLGLYDAHHQLKYLKDPAHFSETFLGEIDYIKPSHRSYDCTMSHSCLLGFLCENLFQGTILCSLKQCLFGISIQLVTVTTKQSSQSDCSVELFASIRCQLS